MKPDLNSWHDKIAHLIPEDREFTKQDYKAGLKSLHKECVHDAIAGYKNNKVLNAPAPSIDPSERDLSRRDRTYLSQLRSSYCKELNSYLHRISRGATPDSCPNCDVTPDNVAHLFDCVENPTDLTTLDLWHRPKEAAAFANLRR